MDGGIDTGMDAAAAERMLGKLHAFVDRELDIEERSALAALLAPGIALVRDQDEAEVQGFAMAAPPTLPAALRAAVVRLDVSVVFGTA